jgi:uncharacterized membrane protein YdbT with pleckstrin-like domain
MSVAPDWVTLTADEQVLWSGHPSHFLAVRSLLGGLALAVFGVVLAALVPALSWFPLVLVPVGVLVVVAGVVSHRSTAYVITSAEVYEKTGLFSRTVTNLRLDRIQNTTFAQSFTERLLGYGDVRVDTAGSGGTELVLRAVPDPSGVNAVLTEQLDRRAR